MYESRVEERVGRCAAADGFHLPERRSRTGAHARSTAAEVSMQRILAALDFSPISERVVALAASLAEAYSAELFLIHIAAPEPDFVGYRAGPEGVRQQRARELRGEHRALQDEAKALRQRRIEAKALLIEGSTTEKLLEESRRLAVDAIVVGSHGHGALYRAVVGSVTEGIIRAAPCPVLVVPVEAAQVSMSS
jgi:nucleotide-binding universal stress UspA family protein